MKCIYQTKHNEYSTTAQSIEALSLNRIEMNQQYLNDGIEVNLT